MPMPKPDEEPKPGAAAERAAKRPAPLPAARRSARPLAPQRCPCRKSLQKHFEEKQRLRQLLLQHARTSSASGRRGTPGPNLAGASGVWTLSGPLEQGGEFRFQLTDGGASLEVAQAARRSGPPTTNWAHRCCRPTAADCCRRSTSGDDWPSRGSAGSARRITTARRRCRAHDGLVDVLVGVAQGRGMPLLLRPGRGPPAGSGDVSRRGRPTLARSISPTIARSAGRFWPGGWRSATATSCSRVLKMTEVGLGKAGN